MNAWLLTCHPEAGEARRGTSQSQRNLRKERCAQHEDIALDLLAPYLCDLRATVGSFAVCAAQDDSLCLYRPLV
jgi:hypothetical protein